MPIRTLTVDCGGAALSLWLKRFSSNFVREFNLKLNLIRIPPLYILNCDCVWFIIAAGWWITHSLCRFVSKFLCSTQARRRSSHRCQNNNGGRNFNIAAILFPGQWSIMIVSIQRSKFKHCLLLLLTLISLITTLGSTDYTGWCGYDPSGPSRLIKWTSSATIHCIFQTESVLLLVCRYSDSSCPPLSSSACWAILSRSSS